ncbi:PLP-dependent aminotransferase family protein [Kineothrix sp. MSJ-39]|uniref:MocR-like pyridoxine biosynthesis transcription factor PdxR n=1 Tax=Kineothrix sp. MSJ-39 TaxID=2841533 RepID=UPI001C1112D6|nr:PLP-dependent aminotransferase family protein [Kineothrix sp. MSJ-39]MBU5429315.1 PLP-dependent aminotransferase family protein [Kineothrix sp. MSJ-39]
MLTIDKKSGVSLYGQLYEQLKQQIFSGNMAAGQRLPATRELAAEYHLSRNTVINAYRQLEVEGYIRPVTGSGYYVENLTSFKIDFPKPATFPVMSKQTAKSYDYTFVYGDLDYNCYSSKTWRKCMLNAYDTLASKDSIAYEEPQGFSNLRHILSGYLYLSRGVKCSAEQIIFTSGHQQSMNMIASLFHRTDWGFAMEDPGYSGTRQVMEHHDFHITPVPVENDGISIDGIQNLFHTLLCVTPSHQFPLGSVLPISKRLQLLEWVKKNDGYIIEDDYDSELRYHNRPIPSLQSIDSSERTIYLGTFSKSLSPDLRMAYMVLPTHLLPSYREKYLYANCTVPALLQLTLAEYIESGEYQRHINAMRTHYRKKHDYIRNYVKENLSGKAVLLGEDAGLHFVLSIQTKRKQDELIEYFTRNRIQIYPTAPFWSNKALYPQNQFLLGFSAIPLTQLPKAMERLSEVINGID